VKIYKIFRPLIFKLEAERAHNLALNYLKFLPKFSALATYPQNYSILNQNICGLNFENPVGLGAGFDKNAEIVGKIFNFGFGFAEAGTVTPLAQSGNSQPRIFRLVEDEAIINRLGFNNFGADYFYHNLSQINRNPRQIIGVNIGKNFNNNDFSADYLLLLEKFYNIADYITINISSPNTKNLRDIQNAENLAVFLEKISAQKDDLQKIAVKNTPIFLKIAPDLDQSQLEAIAELVLKYRIDAVIISNTTIDRDLGLKSVYQGETGGLSGKPLFLKSTQILRQFYQLTKGSIPLIGVGGIASGEDAYTRIKNGASLVQIYSALIYQGFSLVEEIKKYLAKNLEKDGFKNISEAVGCEVK